MVAGVSGESRGTPFSSLFTWNLLTRYGPDVMLKIAEIEVRSLTDLALSPDSTRVAFVGTEQLGVQGLRPALAGSQRGSGGAPRGEGGGTILSWI